MESKYSKRMLDSFPKNLGFVDNKTDPLHVLIDHSGKTLDELERVENAKIAGLFVDTGDPSVTSSAYYVNVETDSMDKVQVIPTGSGKLVSLESEFLSTDITGFDYVETLTPSGTYPSGILGLSYGFDWDEPLVYIVPSGSINDVYSYSDLTATPEVINYTYKTQSYEENSTDEYIIFEEEVALPSGELVSDWNFPSGVLPTDIVKVAYLNHDVVSDLEIIDAGNLVNPRNSDSDGIIVDSSQYAVTGNRVIFAKERPDYNPATLVEIDDVKYYDYPQDYQPDRYFDSTFIVEYKYEENDPPRYLTQDENIGKVGKRGNPTASY